MLRIRGDFPAWNFRSRWRRANYSGGIGMATQRLGPLSTCLVLLFVAGHHQIGRVDCTHMWQVIVLAAPRQNVAAEVI